MPESTKNPDLPEVQDENSALREMLAMYTDADSALPDLDFSIFKGLGEKKIASVLQEYFERFGVEAERRYPDDPDKQKRFLLCLLMSRISRERSIPRNPREIMRDQFMLMLDDTFGQDSEQKQVFMVDLYRAGVYRALDKFILFLESPEFQEVISMLNQIGLLKIADALEKGQSPEIDENLQRSLAATQPVFEKLIDLSRELGSFGFDRPQADTKPDKLFYSKPLNTIDIHDPRMETALIVAENFRHAMAKVFDVQVFGSVPCIAPHLKHFGGSICQAIYLTCQSIPGITALFRAFKNQLIGDDQRKTVSLKDMSLPAYRLLCNRMYLDTKSTELPVSFRSNEPSASIEASSFDEVFLALWEVLKNTMRSGKIEPSELTESERYSHENPYADVIFDEGTVNGQRVTTIEVIDRGAPINLPGIIEKIIAGRTDLFGYGARDVKISELFAGIRNIGDLLSLLSQLNLSIPVGDKDTISTGTGLHVAIESIRKNKGELFCANLPAEQGGGVSFMLVFPKEGKESPVSISDMDLSGAACASLSHNIAQKMALYQQFEQQFRTMAHKENDPDTVIANARMFLATLLAAVYFCNRPVPPRGVRRAIPVAGTL